MNRNHIRTAKQIVQISEFINFGFIARLSSKSEGLSAKSFGVFGCFQTNMTGSDNAYRFPIQKTSPDSRFRLRLTARFLKRFDFSEQIDHEV